MRKATHGTKMIHLLLALLICISLVFTPVLALDAKCSASSADPQGKAQFTPAEAAADPEIQQLTDTSSVLNESDIIYMVLTDRFFDGDSTNNGC